MPSKLLPPTTFEVLSLTPPSPSNTSTLNITIQPTTHNTLNPSTSLSFALKKGHLEIHLDRTPFRSLHRNDDGSVVATVPNLPTFKAPIFGSGDGDGDSGETEVVMHVWKGEKWLGQWDCGSYHA